MAEMNPQFETNICENARSFRLLVNDLVCAEGVADVDGGDLLVTTGGVGLTLSVAAGGAYIQGDTVPNQGMYHVFNDAVDTETVGAAHAALPRIDQIVARVADSTYAGTEDAWHIEVLAGTATAGATLSNLNGAAALPDNTIRLAYVLVPAAFTGPFVDATHILDYRFPYGPCGGRTELFDGSNGTGGTFSGTAGIVSVYVPPRPYPRAVQLHGTCLFLGTSTANTIDSTILRDAGSFSFIQEKVRVTEAVTGSGDFSVPLSGIDYLAADEDAIYTYTSTVSGGGSANTAADALFVRMQAYVTPATPA